jgi:hypothetical protein
VTSFREPFPLGRVVPKDWRHVEKYPLRGLDSAVLMGVSLQAATAAPVEKRIPLPGLRDWYDQGIEGACVGFASSWMMSMLNKRRYDARWLWDRAKERDEWDSTNPGDDQGTSVRAAMDVLRDVGHVRVFRGKRLAVLVKEGIRENRWATTVDEVRACIAAGVPVVLGCNWYANFDEPERWGDWYIGRGNLGAVRGGHAIVARGASDRRQAVLLTNSWGKRYPDVWLEYNVLKRLLGEDGEATVVVDRP